MGIPAGHNIYFVSDAHLGVPDHASSLERERKLVAWLDFASRDATAIHLVGDLFDFWFEYRHAVPRGYVRLLGKLAELRDRGIDLYVYTGNHDLWMFDYFEQELGIPVFREPQTWAYHGSRFLVGHGDGIGPGDHGYKFIKRVFSNRWCQWAFARIHPNLGVGMALYWSRKSRQADAHKDESFKGEAEPQVIYSRQVLAREAYRYFIFGHRHCATLYPLSPDSTFCNLGDWITQFTYAVFDGKELALKTWNQEAPALPDKPAAPSRPQASIARLLLLLLLAAALFSPGRRAFLCAQPIPGALTQEPVAADAQQALYTVPGRFVDLSLDGLGNLFTVSEAGEVCRYREDGALLYRFSEVRLGRVGHLDVSNALRVLVYYPEYLTAVLLSNTLANNGEINFRRLGFNKVRAVGLARDGQLWLYDEANFELIKIDERGQVTRRSEPLNYVLGLDLQPEQLLERNDRLFLRDPQHGILVFDLFGTYEYRFGGAGITHMQVYAEQVLYQNERGIFFHDLRSLTEGPFVLPVARTQRWWLEARRLAVLTPQGIAVHALN
jgi:UDP-2,3-diacylglucosamine hydrolase